MERRERRRRLMPRSATNTALRQHGLRMALTFGLRLTEAILPIAGKGGFDRRPAPIPVFGPLTDEALAGFALPKGTEDSRTV